jgi:hypothetical protein
MFNKFSHSYLKGLLNTAIIQYYKSTIHLCNLNYQYIVNLIPNPLPGL